MSIPNLRLWSEMNVAYTDVDNHFSTNQTFQHLVHTQLLTVHGSTPSVNLLESDNSGIHLFKHPTTPDLLSNDNSTHIANSKFVTTKVNALSASVASSLSLKAPLLTPLFTGNPQAPTQLVGDNSSSLATTLFVNNEIPLVGATVFSPKVNVAGGVNNYAPILNPSFTGVPVALTPALGDDSSTLATTKFVRNNSLLNVLSVGWNLGRFQSSNLAGLVSYGTVTVATVPLSGYYRCSSAFVTTASQYLYPYMDIWWDPVTFNFRTNFAGGLGYWGFNIVNPSSCSITFYNNIAPANTIQAGYASCEQIAL